MAEKSRHSKDEARRITEANREIRREQSEHDDPDTDMPRAEQGYRSQRPREEKDADEPVRSRD